jgi:pyrroline-5-carboxylate reductase
MLKNEVVGIIGAGNMGKALVKGLIKAKEVSKKNIYVSDINIEHLKAIKKEFNINTVHKNNRQIIELSSIIFLAVKPQILDRVLTEIKDYINENHLFISIAAGIPTSFIENFTDKKIRVIRAMPNTCAMVMEAATAITKGTYATDEDLDKAEKIFSAIGRVVTIEESLMDAVTGLSGSGPAYIFVIIEALSDAGVKMGLSREVATILSAQTVLGSAKLLLETGMHPGKLKDMVTSPGGTAIEGLHTLEEGGIRTNLINAVYAATMKSKKLGEKNNTN